MDVYVSFSLCISVSRIALAMPEIHKAFECRLNTWLVSSGDQSKNCTFWRSVRKKRIYYLMIPLATQFSFMFSYRRIPCRILKTVDIAITQVYPNFLPRNHGHSLKATGRLPEFKTGIPTFTTKIHTATRPVPTSTKRWILSIIRRTYTTTCTCLSTMTQSTRALVLIHTSCG